MANIDVQQTGTRDDEPLYAAVVTRAGRDSNMSVTKTDALHQQQDSQLEINKLSAEMELARFRGEDVSTLEARALRIHARNEELIAIIGLMT